MLLKENTLRQFKSEMLCFADSEWVLGHWYIKCMLNGRELTDFTSMAGIAEEKLGHTRALFSFLEEYLELPESQLEFGRQPDSIHAMGLLDAAPQNWLDFTVTLFIAEKALWRFCSTFEGGNFKATTSLMRKFAEESYFHQLCIDGWLKRLNDEEKEQATSVFESRFLQALEWFGTEQQSEEDTLLQEGVRSESLWAARTAFVNDINTKLSPVCNVDSKSFEKIFGSFTESMVDSATRRHVGTSIPSGLWELMIPTSGEAEMARRPLVVSIKDNIDLFQEEDGDETAPVF
ncbi:MAG: Phenylacetic acid catabolic protein [Gammaproteobacteria bacterium]